MCLPSFAGLDLDPDVNLDLDVDLDVDVDCLGAGKARWTLPSIARVRSKMRQVKPCYHRASKT
jgi:hypothetical protein